VGSFGPIRCHIALNSKSIVGIDILCIYFPSISAREDSLYQEKTQEKYMNT
jgi:hypothetical protein